MKTKILVVIASITISSGVFVYFASSYDFAPSTTENPFGVEGQLVYVRDLKITCIQQPCKPVNTFAFRYNSQEPVQLVGINICGGVFCIKNDGFGSSGLGGNETHRTWGGSQTVGDIPWKVGDTVDIRVKVKPAHISENEEIISEDEMYFIDLGKSKIIEVEG